MGYQATTHVRHPNDHHLAYFTPENARYCKQWLQRLLPAETDISYDLAERWLQSDAAGGTLQSEDWEILIKMANDIPSDFKRPESHNLF